jgi:predicted esterase
LHESLQESLSYISNTIQRLGPFYGLIGFSQGASIASTAYEHMVLNNFENSLKYIICIGGVETYTPLKFKIKIKSLHLMGQEDEHLEQSKLLVNCYDKECATIIEYNEGHNIPSIRTGIYHLIKKWVWEDEGYDFIIQN